MPARATKKPTRTVKRATPAVSQPIAQTTTQQPPLQKKHLLWGLLLLLAIALLYYFRGLFVVAVVNNRPITRLEFTQELQSQAGKQTMQSLITKTLIAQEADKQNVTVSPQDIDAEIKKIEESLKKNGQNLDQALATQGISKESLRDQIKVRKLVEKMLAKDIEVTDKEANDYIEKNKSSFPEGTNMNETKKGIKEQLKQQKLSEKFQPWLENLQKNAKITYWLNI